MTLKERCQAFLEMESDDPAEDLLAFVLAEFGRTADEKLEKTVPLCLYFDTDADREEFIAVFKEAKPNVRSRRMP